MPAILTLASIAICMGFPGFAASRLEECIATELANDPTLDKLVRNAAAYKSERDLWDISSRFGPDFENDLLRAKRHIFDVGMGDGIAVREYVGDTSKYTAPPANLRNRIDDLIQLPASSKARVSGFTLSRKDTSTPWPRPDRFQAFEGRYFEDVPNAEIVGKFGQAEMGWEFWGGLAYSSRPSEVAGKIWDTLEAGRPYYLPVLGAARLSSLFTHRVILADGSQVTFVDWLRRLPGFRFEQYEGPRGDVLVKLTKLDGPKPVLKRLVLAQPVGNDTPPPIRVFREVVDSPAPKTSVPAQTPVPGPEVYVPEVLAKTEYVPGGRVLKQYPAAAPAEFGRFPSYDVNTQLYYYDTPRGRIYFRNVGNEYWEVRLR